MLFAYYVLGFSRVQIDLIDFQSMKDGVFKYLLTYVDHGTKYAVVKSLKSKVITCWCFFIIYVTILLLRLTLRLSSL